MRYVQINAYANGWADSIIFSKHRELQATGHESWVFWARGEHEQDEYMQKIASYPEICLDALCTRIDGRAGFHSRGVTRRLIQKLDAINPDVVHLHVLLGYYINVQMLFEWLMRHECKVVWTLHDCWAFTGHCIHFTYSKCEQWKSRCSGCDSCPQKKTYPETYFGGDHSVRLNFDEKKRLFTQLPADRMQLITPSRWLADLVKQSFLAKYDVTVKHNPINTDIYKPMESDFRQRYSIGSRCMVLGVAGKWSERKGLVDFIRLAHELDSDRFAIVVVGLNKKQMKSLPSNIIGLPRTNTLDELARIYSAADVFFNPTQEDNFPTVNLEAEACGTPVVTYNTGGCGETISLETSKVVSSYEEAIYTLRETVRKNRFRQ